MTPNPLPNADRRSRLLHRPYASGALHAHLNWPANIRQVLLALLLTMAAGLLHCETLSLTALPAGSLGLQVSVLKEDGPPLSLAQAQARQGQGLFRPGSRPVLNYGIGSRPIWVHLELLNPTDQIMPLRLVTGATWLDRLDVFIVQDGRLSASWQTGDEQPAAYGLTAAIGYVFPVRFAPGRSELYMRVDSIDPLVLPLELIPEPQAVRQEMLAHYAYGFIYGFLLALAAYNVMLFIGVGDRSYLYYSLYLACLIVGIMSYSGFGYAWLWPNQPLVQRYVILIMMVLIGCTGLLFASRFLSLAQHAPRVLRLVQLYAGVGLGLLGLCLLGGSQLGAALLAFSFLTLFTLGMVVLGVCTIRAGKVASARYFLAAALCGMLGTASTALSVWGWIPYTTLTYHAVEYGALIEATLLARAVAFQMRSHRQAVLHAENLARHDPLTGLLNRRAFLELAGPLWNMSIRGQRPLTLIMLDLDHFKHINDQQGHDAGDRVLVGISQMLAQACRASDLLARWGGEEFILLLPDTNLEQAHAFAERLRGSIEARPVPRADDSIPVTASFGVAERGLHADLEALIKDADVLLYEAKQSGRNRVSCALE